MTRPMRTLLIIALIGVVAVIAPGLMAKRFASMAEPTLSIDEAIERSQKAAALQPDIEAGAADSSDPAVVTPAVVDTAAIEDVEDFIAVRTSYLAELENRPSVFHQMKIEIDDKMEDQNRNPMHLDATMELSLLRRIKMAEREMSLDTYLHVRESFRGYMAGEGTVDPALLPAFVQRRDQLEPIWLGAYEAADL